MPRDLRKSVGNTPPAQTMIASLGSSIGPLAVLSVTDGLVIPVICEERRTVRRPDAMAASTDLAEVGAPVTRDDLAMHRASVERPLHVRLKDCVVSSSPPPTQGFASLLIMALIDRVGAAPESLAQVHAIVEATKLAFAIRNRDVHDPAFMTLDCQGMLDDVDLLDMMAARINPAKAAPWLRGGCAGDTTWIGAADRDGCVVSMIQSIYFEFGSGVVLPRTGLLWQNRGTSFRLAADGWNALAPGRLPFHTLNPSMALFDDGRVMAFGAMGGEGQPQTQAALFTRYARNGMSLADSVAAPRWLLGRTWGDETTALRVESRLDAKVVDGLRGVHPELETEFDRVHALRPR